MRSLTSLRLLDDPHPNVLFNVSLVIIVVSIFGLELFKRLDFFASR